MGPRLASLFREWIRSRRRMALLAIGLLAVGLYEVARAFYRPWVHSTGRNDFHVADTLGNSLGTVTTVFVFASAFGRTHSQTLFVLRASAIAVAVYELAHPLLGKSIDPFDVLVTALAGVVCQAVHAAAFRRDLRAETTGNQG